MAGTGGQRPGMVVMQAVGDGIDHCHLLSLETDGSVRGAEGARRVALHAAERRARWQDACMRQPAEFVSLLARLA